MPVPIHPEPEFDPTCERCCICRSPARFWTSLPDRKLGQQVAICQHCAARAEPRDIPTKPEWSRREHIAHHPTIGEVSSGRDREYPPAPVVTPKDDK